MYPSISPSLLCGLLPAAVGTDESHYWPNTVVQAEDDKKGHGLCQFSQLPPCINQKARLNVQWLIRLTDKKILSTITAKVNWEMAIRT